ncbi:MFS transporter [Streptomyces carpinensis]|uniref:MFS transporter n=1 Tax=Streptomyces carpinensis TaxID=66369 RepID=A0ABV1W686_9ACTN
MGLVVLLLAGAMAIIDPTATNVALPSLGSAEGFAASQATLSWAVSGYTVAFAIALVPAGRLGDRHGHRRLFVIGTSLYVLTGVAVVLAVSQAMLSISRVLHGAAGGMMIAAVFGLIQLMFTGPGRVRAIAAYTAMTGVASLVGPLAGGWLVDAAGLGTGWRWALALALPFGATALAFAGKLTSGQAPEKSGRFDILGMLLLAGAIGGCIIPLIQATGEGVPSWSWDCWSVAVVLTLAFVLWERRLGRRGLSPVLPMNLFRRAPFSLGTVSIFFAFASFGLGIYVALAILWQSGRGESALSAALVALPFSVGSILGAVISDRTAAWIGHWVVPGSLAALGAGLAVTWWILAAAPQAGSLVLAVPLFVGGLGSGAFVGPSFAAALSGVPGRDAGAAGGMVMTGQWIGTAFGGALVLVVCSRPGPGGGFGPEAAVSNGTAAVLVCATLVAAALICGAIVSFRSGDVLNRVVRGADVTPGDATPTTPAVP